MVTNEMKKGLNQVTDDIYSICFTKEEIEDILEECDLGEGKWDGVALFLMKALEKGHLCKTCSHRQVWDNETIDRCAYYKDSLCKKAYEFCKGEHYLDKKQGLSIYAMQSWIKRMTKEEKELPIKTEIYHKTFAPISVHKAYKHGNEYWTIYNKEDTDE